MSTEEILLLARRQLDDSDAWMDFAQEVRALYGWECSEESAMSRVSQWLQPGGRYHFPATALLPLIRVTRSSLVLQPLERAAMHVELEREPRKPARPAGVRLRSLRRPT